MLATLIYRTGWISLLVLLFGALSFRFGWLPFRVSFSAYGLGLVGCALVVVAAGVAVFVTMARGGDTGRWLLLLVVCAIPVAIVVARVGVAGFRAPPIHDITTDTVNPPLYQFAQTRRRAGDNSLVYVGEEVAVLQRQAYPDIQTLQLAAPVAAVYAMVQEIIVERGWTVSGEAAAGETALGAADATREANALQVEAVATTPLFGFRDDVVIRVRPRGAGAEVDMRSASRLGVSDLGVNGARVRSVLGELATRFE